MRAIVQDTYGSPDVLEQREIDPPEIGDDEVLVRIHAAGVDRGVWHLMTGLPYLVRIMGYGFSAPATRVRGDDFAGRIEAVGNGVTRFKPGDEVFGICRGSFAEYACAKQGKIAPMPTNIDFEQAAALPTSGLTALQGLRDHAQVEAAQRVLIIGASGGVGSFAVQFAKAFGTEVTGVCSTAKVDLVRSLGADNVIDYTREDIQSVERPFDVILDIAGNRPLSSLRRALTPHGTLVIVGGEGGGRWLGGVDRQLRGMILSPLVSQNLRSFVATANSDDLQLLKEQVEAEKVAPVIDRIFPLSEAPDAIRYLEDGRARGKTVISIADRE